MTASRLKLGAGIVLVLMGIFLLMSGNKEQDSEILTATQLESKDKTQLYLLDGAGEKWNVQDYTILIGEGQIMRGKAELTFKGDPSELEKTRHFEVVFYEQTADGEKQGVFSTEYHVMSTAQTPLNIITNVKELGFFSQEYSYDELKKDVTTYESTFAEVKWDDETGKAHEEVIELNIRKQAELADYSDEDKSSIDK